MKMKLKILVSIILSFLMLYLLVLNCVLACSESEAEKIVRISNRARFIALSNPISSYMQHFNASRLPILLY